MKARVLAAVAVMACGGKTAKEPVDSMHDPVGTYSALAVAMCSCEDQACGEPLVGQLAPLQTQVIKVGDIPKFLAAKRMFDECADDLGVAFGPHGEGVVDIRRFADDICACKDMECVGAVQKDFAWKNTNKKGDVKLSEREAKAVAEASDKITKCIEKIADRDWYREESFEQGDDLVEDYRRLANVICACKDTDCLMKRMQEAQDLGTKASETAARMTAEDGRAIAAASQKMSDCAAKITGGAP